MESESAAHKAFTALWVDHSAAVRAFAWRRCPAALVDDVVSETFVVAWRHIHEVPGDARVWLLGCARRVLHTQLRSRDRYQALHDRIASAPAGPTLCVDDQVAERTDLAKAWNRLTEADREVLALTVWEGLTSAQAARVIGCTSLAFRARLSRARHRLAAHLAGRSMPGAVRLDRGTPDRDPGVHNLDLTARTQPTFS